MNKHTNDIREILEAVYGCGRNSRLKLSDQEQVEVWMSVDQALEAINKKFEEAVDAFKHCDDSSCAKSSCRKLEALRIEQRNRWYGKEDK